MGEEIPDTDLVPVPAGQVTLSGRRTRRSRAVEAAPYELARLPVTQARYAEVTGERPSTARGERLPVGSVSWWDAVRYCNALSDREGFAPAYRFDGAGEGDGIEWDRSADGYRLPTEAEWDHACRAGSEGPRHGPLDLGFRIARSNADPAPGSVAH